MHDVPAPKKSPDIISVIKSKTTWAGHAASMGERRGTIHTGFWWRHLRERGHLADPGVDWRIILRSIFTKCDGGGGMDWIKLAQYRDR